MRYVEMEPEIWKDIEGYEEFYQISSHGNVKCLSRRVNGRYGILPEKLMSIWRNHRGYRMITIHKNGKKKGTPVHILVANAFVPNPENKPEVNHLDGDKENNYFKNLERATRLENQHHSIHVLGNHFWGEKHSMSKLTEEKVKEIILLYRSGKYTYVSLAKLFMMEETQIARIIKRKSWKNLKID